MDILQTLTKEFALQSYQVEKAVSLMDEGNTVPFISRYRKEATGSLDDTVLRDLSDRLQYLRNLEKRKAEVSNSIQEQEKLTPEVAHQLEKAQTLTEVEDIYRPFKPHRKTRASVAREKGLEDLAILLFLQESVYEPSLEEIAASFVNEEKGVSSIEDALNGACDIIAEDISDHADYRKDIRILTFEHSTLVTKQIKEEDSIYSMYYDYSEKITTLPGHRILAIARAEKEGFIKANLAVVEEIPLNYLFAQIVVVRDSPAKRLVSKAVIDSYERLIAPSIERDIRSQLFDIASEGAIKVFAENLKNLLMQTPLKGKTVLGLDPGFRTGCKLAVVDRTGKVLDTDVIYPTKPQERTEESKKIVKRLIRAHNVGIIAIGNGTASRESELFVAELLHEIPEDVKYIIVSEAGASVYSASKLGAEEFPDFDVTQRSAVSIARRLQDPLAELVKIDPKSIGVGQYQHDMKQAKLDESLTGVVEDCVNAVGVDINTASYALLSYISGINATSAKNIVKYREENGEFQNRTEIRKVPRIGAKAYEQCAGFLRVSGSDEILDRTGVHPESYPVTKKLLKKFALTAEDVATNRTKGLKQIAEKQGLSALCKELDVGEPTLLDILDELEKPGRDVRDELPPPILRDTVMEMKDLKEDMILTGTVRNVIDFGAFVDIGVHQDGLLHISQICDHYIKHPKEVLSIGDIVQVRVLSVDLVKKRIALTMKK